ncbi:MAG: hypothetical protein KBG28_31295 [Kofleriaceae bacterium]|jgi:hypothetical protein|nr:hypothetical protein [Kofleriaceae bacterium]MBP6838941.1 hypothetical protein [Kofleriaceae bacterium]MBP9208496.1 hypothetical protein [Kofleriaceae bacterium]
MDRPLMLRSRRWSRLGLRGAAALALAGGCTTQVNRAALVPHMTPMTRDGAPLQSTGELQVGASSLAHLSSPEAGDDTSAVEVPGTQAEAVLRLALGEHLSLGLLYAHGFDATAKKTKATQVPVDVGDVRGYGLSMTASLPTRDPRLHIGLGAELLTWSVPWVEYAVCVDPLCGDPPWTLMTEGRDLVSQLAASVIPTYRTGNLTFSAGITARNHPTIDQKGIEQGLDLGDDVRSGPFNMVLSAGAGLELGAGMRANVVLYVPVDGAPVSYGPSAAANLLIPLGPRRADRTPTPAPPPPPAAPTGPGGL